MSRGRRGCAMPTCAVSSVRLNPQHRGALGPCHGRRFSSIQERHVNPEISGGAIAILRHMCRYRLKLNGDPTKDIPWFYLPTEVVARKTTKGSKESNQPKKTGVDAVDAPAAKYCLELIKHGLIHLDSGSREVKAGNYTVSEDGEKRAK